MTGNAGLILPKQFFSILEKADENDYGGPCKSEEEHYFQQAK